MSSWFVVSNRDCSYVDSLKARIRELESQQERPSLQTKVQHDDMPFTPETGPQNYRGVDPGPLQVNPEAIRSSENHAVIPSPSDQPHPHRDQSADSANGLSNPSYLLPDWSLDVSLPLNTSLASLVNLDEGAATVTDNEDDGVDAMGVIACFPAPNCGRKRRPSNYFGPSSTKGLLDKARTAIDKGRRTDLPDSFVTPSSQITEDRPLHFTGCTSTVLWI